MINHFLLIGECNTTDTLQGVVGLVTEEVGRGVLHDLEGLDLASVLDVRTTAQINQRTAPIDCSTFARHEFVDVVQLVFAIGEHLPQIALRDIETLKVLFLLENLCSPVIKGLPVGLADDTSIHY